MATPEAIPFLADRDEPVEVVVDGSTSVRTVPVYSPVSWRVSRDALLVRVCSWNVGEAVPDDTPAPSRMLLPWLLGTQTAQPHWTDRPLNDPDVVAVGLQEVDMTCSSMLWACCSRGTDRGSKWGSVLTRVMREAGYTQLDCRHLGGLFLIMFAKDSVAHLAGAVEISTVASGFCCGTCWNKGTVSARVIFKGLGQDCSMCFVNSHFAAKAAKLERRNWEHDRVSARTLFRGSPHRIHDHDYVFWFGDLNYRLDLPEGEYQGRSRKEVKNLLRQESLAHDTMPDAIVDRCDQLTAQIRVGRVFTGFSEARIDFRPTYKVLPGQERHDMRRQPSYTDRVLYYQRDRDDGDVVPAAGSPGSPAGGPAGVAGSAASRIDSLGVSQEGGPERFTSRTENTARSRQTSHFEPLPSHSEPASAGADAPQRRVLCLQYSAVTDMPIADHRPVHALFALPCLVPAVAE